MDRRCASCGGASTADGKFCPLCGSAYPVVTAPAFCSGCGGRLNADSKFCGSCGHVVGASAASAPPPAAPVPPRPAGFSDVPFSQPLTSPAPAKKSMSFLSCAFVFIIGLGLVAGAIAFAFRLSEERSRRSESTFSSSRPEGGTEEVGEDQVGRGYESGEPLLGSKDGSRRGPAEAPDRREAPSTRPSAGNPARDSSAPADSGKRSEASSAPGGAASNASSVDLPEPLGKPLDQATQVIRASGGEVRLKDGARISFPAGAVNRDAKVTFKKASSREEGWNFYEIDGPLQPLAAPATVEIPVPAPSGDEVAEVKIVHYHDRGDEGRELAVAWKPGESVARVQIREFSLIGVLIVLKTAAVIHVATELTIASLSTDEKVLAGVKAALAKAGNPSVFLNVPYYHQGMNTYCWAAALTMLGQAPRSLSERIHEPFKPQDLVASLGDDYPNGLPVRAWMAWSEPWETLKKFSGASDSELELKHWWDFPAMFQYGIDNLDQGYPMAVYIQSVEHFQVWVGYEPEAILVQDPNEGSVCVMAVGWTKYAEILRKAKWKAVNGGVYTAVIRKPVASDGGALAMNVPNCTRERAHDTELNRLGCYFTSPHEKIATHRHAGFRWNAKRVADSGALLVTGWDPQEPVESLGAGAKTDFGYAEVNVANNSTGDLECVIEASLVDPRHPDEAVVLHRQTCTVPGQGRVDIEKGLAAVRGKLSTFGIPKEVPILDLLPKEMKGPTPLILRMRLLQGEAETDRVDLPFTMYALRIVKSIPEVSDGLAGYTLAGSGFRMPGVEPVLTLREGHAVPLSKMAHEKIRPFSAGADGSGSFVVPEEMIPDSFLLRTPEGVESNEVPGRGGKLACTRFEIYVPAPATLDEVHTPPSPLYTDVHEKKIHTIEMEIPNEDGANSIPLAGNTFARVFDRQEGGHVGSLQISGTLSPDMSRIVDLSVSFQQTFHETDDGDQTDEDERWSLAFRNIPLEDHSEESDEYTYEVVMHEGDPLPEGFSVPRGTYVYKRRSTYRNSDGTTDVNTKNIDNFNISGMRNVTLRLEFSPAGK